jgi:hypothetical protein
MAHPFQSHRKGWVIEQSETVAYLDLTETSKKQRWTLMPAYPQYRLQPRVPHPFQSHRKGWVIEQSETAVAYLDPTETSKVEVKH